MNQPGATPWNRLTALFRRREIAAFLRSHRYSLLISFLVTAIGLALYVAINFNESLRSAFVFIDNIEARSLDARFQLRGPVKPAPEIAIVAIDQKTYDKLGWPFPRSYYGQMVDTLRRDGAKVVGFDITFNKPDRSAGSAATLAQLEQQYQALHGVSAADPYLQQLRALREQADSDAAFAKAIKNSGNVILGHLFFTDRNEIKDMDPVEIQEYAELLAFDAYPQTAKVNEETRPGMPPRRNFPYVLHSPAAVAVEPNMKMFAEAAHNFGAFNFDADSDGIFRRAQFVFEYRDPESTGDDQQTFYPSLDVQMARLYLGAGPQETTLYFSSKGPEHIELALRDGARNISMDGSGKVLLNFAGPAQTYPYYSFSDVASGLTPPGTFRDKIVLVGATAIGIGDMRPIPFGKQNYPGVEIHANVLDNLLHDRFLKRSFPEEMTDLWVLLLCGILMGCLFVAARPAVATLLYLIALAALLGFIYLQFAQAGRWLSLVLPAATLSLNYLGVASYRVLFEEKEKRKVRGAFSQYVAPGYITQILKDPGRLKLGGEEAELTVMFSDIRDFTSISEKMTPAELVELLNQYLTEMTEIVFQTRGTLDKYIGDAVMAFWGRPFVDLYDHAACSCRAALRMRKKLAELNAQWTAQGRPELRIGIGINSGPMMVGNMGSERRFNYTVMGDHVNLGSRVEGLNKEYGTQIILTEYTLQQVGEEFATRKLDLIRVKGKQKPVAIYELLGAAAERASHAGLIGEYERGLAAYQKGDWGQARACFERLADKYPGDRPTQVFLARCEELLQASPQGAWDGVYTMTHK